MENFNKEKCIADILEDMRIKSEEEFKSLVRCKLAEILVAQKEVSSALEKLGKKKSELKELQYISPDFSALKSEDI